MKKFISSTCLCAVSTCLLATAPAHGSQSDQSINSYGDIEEVIITGSRTPVPLRETLASATVISAEDLERLQPVDLVDVLAQVPGIDIGRDGGPGSVASVFMRGTGSGHTLILVDGQRMNSATTGGTSFQFLDPAQIERIEIIRGSASSLYGSDAMGGVIQIFTKDGKAAPASSVSVSSGSYNTHSIALGSRGGNGSWRYSADASFMETEGIDNHVNTEGFNADRDGYRNLSFSGSAGYRFTEAVDLSLRFLQSDSRNEYDNVFDPGQRPYSTNRLQNLNARLDMALSETWRSQLSLGQAIDDNENRDSISGTSLGDFRTRRAQLYWQNDFQLARDQLLTLGYDFYEDQVRSSSGFVDARGNAVDSRNNHSVFAQYLASWNWLSLQAGIREDRDEEFGSHVTGNVSAGITLNAQHRLVASWSEGFKAPSFNDLYWPAGTFSAGNPDLQPESSENYEVSLRADYESWYWLASYYETDISKLINWAAGSDFVWRPYNVNDAEINGAELVAGTRLRAWRLEGSLNYTDPRDVRSGNRLPNRATRTALISVDRDLQDWSVGVQFKAQNGRYTDAANTQKLSGYSVTGLRSSYRPSEQLSISASVDNIFDRGYQLSNGYRQYGRNWQLGLNWVF